MRKFRGFTLIELVIVVAIVAILAMIALPSYTNFIRKSRRSDVQSSMQDIALKQERFRADCSTYASSFGFACPGLATLTFPTNPYTSSYYTLALAGTATSYKVTATPVGTQANDTASGTACTSLVYDFGTATAGQLAKTPAACWNK